ncbi:MAG: peptidylprolyl isomerase [Candidatus Kapabacteria bacterium]|nr:peptidylprolyl isomerase [Candidatus Kapabacteria bacterium]
MFTRNTLGIAISVFITCCVLIPASAQKPAKPPKVPKKALQNQTPAVDPNAVLATIGDEKILYSEVETAFKRNMNRRNTPLLNVKRDSVLDFLNLYVKYRLKVKDAFTRSFDKDTAVVKEINNNRKLLSETYLFDKKVVEPNIEKYVERRKRELQVGVMVFIIGQGENVDTTKAYAKAMACLNLVKSGTDFKKVAKDSSEDVTTKPEGGVLPYMTSLGGIIKSLEDVAYSLKAGEVYPAPVRSRNVYLVVKLLAEQPKTAIRVSQILVPTYDGEDSTAAMKRADSLTFALKNKPKQDFAAVAMKMSVDKGSAEKGGDLDGYYSRSLGFEKDSRKLMPTFEEKMFSLKDGEIGWVSTDYGVHVIRRDSTKPFNLDEEKDNVKKLYKKYYFEDDKRTYIESEKTKRGYKWNEAVLSEFLGKLDATKMTTDSTWYKNLDDALRAKTIYSTPKTSYTTGALADSLRKRTDMRGVTLNRSGITNAMNKVVDPLVTADAASSLETEYPDFANLVREFRDGILLFKVEEQEVWSKLKFDSTVARSYYDSTRTRYMTENRYDVSEIHVSSDSLARSLYDQVMANNTKENFEKLAELNTQRNGYREKKGSWGVISVKNNKLAQQVDQMKPRSGDVIAAFPFEKGFSVVRVNETQPPRTKTFEEAIPDFAPAYQDLMQKRLSEQWIARLREKFPVQIQFDTVNSIFKQ